MKLILVLFRLPFVRPPVHPLDLLLFVWIDRRGLRQYGLSEVYRMSKTAVFRNSLWTLGDGGEEKKWKKYFNQSYFRFLFFKIYIIFHYCAVKRNICNYSRFLSIWIVVCHCFDIVYFFLFPLAYLSATVRSIDLLLGYREWWMKPAITSKTWSCHKSLLNVVNRESIYLAGICTFRSLHHFTITPANILVTETIV